MRSIHYGIEHVAAAHNVTEGDEDRNHDGQEDQGLDNGALAAG